MTDRPDPIAEAMKALEPFATAFDLNSTDGPCLTANDWTAMRNSVDIQDFRRACAAHEALAAMGDQAAPSGETGKLVSELEGWVRDMWTVSGIDEDDRALLLKTAAHLTTQAAEIARLTARLEEVEGERDGRRKQLDACEQIAGKVLGYPWFKDDQKNFPGATEADGVCIGEHVAETIVEELARRFTAPAERAEYLFERLQAIIDWADLALRLPHQLDSHGVRNLDGPVFDAARDALCKYAAAPAPPAQPTAALYPTITPRSGEHG
jgi:hypothetical protein